MTMMATIQAAERSHLGEIIELLAELHGETPVLPPGEDLGAIFDAITRDPNRTLLVALEDSTVVGTLDVAIIANIGRGGRPWGVLENFVVAAGARERGVGSTLLAIAVDICRQASCYKVQLVSHRRHLNAVGFYKRSGFDAPVRGFRRYLG